MSRLVRFFRSKYWKKKLTKTVELLYVLYDSNLKCNSSERILFVDCGSNTGQGYTWFSKFFRGPNITFELFEPNPNCHRFLENLIIESGSRRVVLNKCGVGTKNCRSRFFGLDSSEGGLLAQGGSTLEKHNSLIYDVRDRAHIEVQIIDFSDYLLDKSKCYDKIIVKMDIEGAEVELLENLLSDLTINKICVLYVEFHSKYQAEPLATETRRREQNILRILKKETRVAFRLWH